MNVKQNGQLHHRKMTEQVSSFTSSADGIHLSNKPQLLIEEYFLFGTVKQSKSFFHPSLHPFLQCFLPQHTSDMILRLKAAQHSDFPLKS